MNKYDGFHINNSIFFTPADLETLIEIYKSTASTDELGHRQPQDGFLGAVTGKMGGVRRRAKQRAILEFCRKIQFPDITLHGMKYFMRQLFKTSVSNDKLMEWATPGRKANDRVDLKQLDSIIEAYRSEATSLMGHFDWDWNAIKAKAHKTAFPQRYRTLRSRPRPGKRVIKRLPSVTTPMPFTSK